MRDSIDSRLARVASTQHGVVSAQQLRAADIDRGCVQRRIVAGTMCRVLPRVYAVGPSAVVLSDEGYRMAAVLHGGQTSALSHEAAAARHEIWSRGPREVHVSTTTFRLPVAAPWLVLHRSTTLRGDEIELVERIPVTTVLRTCLDLGQVLSPEQIANVIHEATFRRVLVVDELAVLLDQHPCRRGTAAVRQAVRLHRAGSVGTRSRTEDRLLERMKREGIVEPIVNTRGATGIPALEVDFAWPEHRLVVEVDGSGHLRPGDIRIDGERDRVLGIAGWRVVRVPAGRVWNDMSGVIRGIRGALAATSA